MYAVVLTPHYSDVTAITHSETARVRRSCLPGTVSWTLAAVGVVPTSPELQPSPLGVLSFAPNNLLSTPRLYQVISTTTFDTSTEVNSTLSHSFWVAAVAGLCNYGVEKDKAHRRW